MKKTFFAIALFLSCGLSAFAQSYNFNISGLQFSSGAAVPGSCSPEGRFFFKNTATKGWYICIAGTYSAIASGVVAPASGGVAAVTVANQGGIFLPTLYMQGANAAQAVIASNNQVRYMSVVIPFRQTVNLLTANIGAVSASATQTADFGLYSADGTTLLFDAQINVSTGQAIGNRQASVSGAPITLNAGVYLFAYTCSDAAVTFLTVNTLTGANGLMNFAATKQYGTAGNAATSGVLPATLGTLTTANTANNAPLVYLGS